jgi:hypothetical protein
VSVELASSHEGWGRLLPGASCGTAGPRQRRVDPVFQIDRCAHPRRSIDPKVQIHYRVRCSRSSQHLPRQGRSQLDDTEAFPASRPAAAADGHTSGTNQTLGNILCSSPPGSRHFTQPTIGTGCHVSVVGRGARVENNSALGSDKALCLMTSHRGGQRMALGHCTRADADEADGSTHPFHVFHNHLH